MLVAVGDVHGQAELLEDLLARIRAAGLLGAARLVLVGDLIDRGPDPRGVLDRCLDLRARHPDTVFLRGNHEQLLLDALDARDPSVPGCPERPAVRAPLAAWLACGGAATLRSYGVDARPLKSPELGAWREAIPADHLAFLRSMTMEHIAERHHFVHAGLPPDGTMDAGPGGRDPRLWIREEFLRSDSDFGGRTVVHGHTPYRDGRPVIEETRIGIDTGAAYGGPLTAVALAPGVAGSASVAAVLQAFPRGGRSATRADGSQRYAGR